MTSPRTALVADLAPVAPPCFRTRSIWIEYLKSAVEEARSGHPMPLVFKRGELVRFNYGYNFCADCSKEHGVAMARQELCRPSHLRLLERALPRPRPWLQVDWISGVPTPDELPAPALPKDKSDLMAQLRVLTFTVPQSVRNGPAQRVWEWRTARNRAAMFAANVRSGLRTLRAEINNLAGFQ